MDILYKCLQKEWGIIYKFQAKDLKQLWAGIVKPCLSRILSVELKNNSWNILSDGLHSFLLTLKSRGSFLNPFFQFHTVEFKSLFVLCTVILVEEQKNCYKKGKIRIV